MAVLKFWRASEMENKTVSILSTRPLDANTLKNLPDNFQIDIVSFIETTNIVDAFIEQKILTTARQKQTIVFTSMNAAEAVVEILQKINCNRIGKYIA